MMQAVNVSSGRSEIISHQMISHDNEAAAKKRQEDRDPGAVAEARIDPLFRHKFVTKEGSWTLA